MKTLIRTFSYLPIAMCSLFFLFHQKSFGFTIEPAIRNYGQALLMNCDPNQESECTLICDSASFCEIRESICKNCSGTQNLGLKRILDEVGTGLVANENVIPSPRLIEILTSGNFITLHAKSIYNFSSPYNGTQIKAQFQFLCEHSLNSRGLLVMGTDPDSHQIIGILGAICMDDSTHSAEFRELRRPYSTLSVF